MVHKVFFFTLYLFSITLHCSQSNDNSIDTSEWTDISQESDEIIKSIENDSKNYLDLGSEFVELRKNVKQQFVQARSIIQKIRDQLEDLSQNEEKYLPTNEQLIATTTGKIEELQKLANSLEIKNNCNYYIDNSLNQSQSFDPRNGSLSSQFSTYVVRAEIIFFEIFKTTQALGVPLDDDPNNI